MKECDSAEVFPVPSSYIVLSSVFPALAPMLGNCTRKTNSENC